MKNYLLPLLFMIPALLFAQEKITFSGYILDEITLEPLLEATIISANGNFGTTTNEYGFYSITIPKQNSTSMIISFVGYQTKEITFGAEKSVTIHLHPGVDLGEVKILKNQNRNEIRENQTGVVKLQTKQIESLPNFFGETDIIKILQLTPGVQSGGEGQSNLYVRGGSPDQNLILLDGIPLYYVAHFGGFISIFNTDALSDTKLIKGGFPARYGSRLSSVLDIKMKNGNKKEFSGQGAIGLLSSKLLLEGPIRKGKASFLVSIRKNMLPVFKIFGADLDYGFYDLNAKLDYSFSAKDKLFFSTYLGNDKVGVKNKIYYDDYKQKDKRETNWGNTVLSLKWNHIFSENISCRNVLGISNYKNSNNFNYSSTADSMSTVIESKVESKIKDISIASDFNWVINPSWNIRFGPSVIFHTFIPNTEKYFVLINNNDEGNSYYNSEENAIETAFYIENDIKTKHFGANLGGRFSSYQINNQNYLSFEPRLLFNLIITNNLSLKYSYSEMNQYVHLLSYSGVGMPTDYWMPSTENVKPQNSIQHSLGLNKSFKNEQYQVSIEGYHKEMNNLVAFRPGESLIGHLDEWTKTIETDGDGISKGVELFIQKLTGKTTGWIGGTVSKANRKFTELNNGETFSFKYDRLLDISIAVIHKLNEHITISGNWSYGSGYPTTLPTERYDTEAGEVYAYNKINSFKMRDFHRLDLAVNYSYKTSWGESSWTFSVFNVYNRKNPYYYYFERETINTVSSSGVTGTAGNTYLYQKSLFPFFPSFAYSFKF